MRAFEYACPGSLADAVALLADRGPQARVLAGGTDLLIDLRDRSRTPSLVVDIKRIPEVAPSIVRRGAALRISARTTMTQVMADEDVRRTFPALAEAAAIIGSIQIRNRATLVGNQCNGSPAADTAPPLLVYGARLLVAGPGRQRSVTLDDFFVSSGVTRLAPDELVTAIELPWPPGAVGSAFARRTRRRGHDLASVTLAVAVSGEGTLRLAYGSLGPRPRLFESMPAEAPLDEWLAASQPSPTSMRASPDYRRAMLRLLADRAVATARQRLAGA